MAKKRANGEGNIRKRKDGRWEGRYTAGYLDEADRRHVLPMFYLELVSGLRKGELVALLWSDLDVANQTISVSKQATRDENGNIVITRPKTETSVRLVSIPQKAVELLQREHLRHPDNPYMFSSTRTG